MDRDLIRLECLKLWHRHDRDPAQVVEMSKQYEAYIVGDKDEKKEKAKALEKKMAGNPDFFK